MLDAGEDVNQIDMNTPGISQEEIMRAPVAFVDAHRDSTVPETCGRAGIHVAVETWNEPLLRLLANRGADLYLVRLQECQKMLCKREFKTASWLA
jgi:hypothetical protein